MKNRKAKAASRIGVRSHWRRYLLSISVLCLVGLACVLLSRHAEAKVTVVRTGVAPNFVVTFTNDGTAPVDNQLQLRFSTAGSNNLEFSLDGGSTFSSNLGGGNTAPFANLSTIVVNFGGGSNDLVLNLQAFTFNATINPDSGNSLQSDAVLTDTVSGHVVAVNVTSAQIVKFAGDGNDNLTVQSGQGDSTTRIQNSPGIFTDEVRASDYQPRVEFASINTFTFSDVGFGTNVVTFATQNLGGANAYQSMLDSSDDTFVIEGADGLNDSFTLTRPAAGQVRVTDNTPAPPVAVTLSQRLAGPPPPPCADQRSGWQRYS